MLTYMSATWSGEEGVSNFGVSAHTKTDRWRGSLL